MRYANVLYHTEIPPEKIPNTIDFDKVTKKYSKHAYHLGAWPETESFPTNLPKINETSHVIRDVKINENGGLYVSFEFLSSPRGFELMKKFNEKSFELTPIISDDGCSILRFDFQQED